MHHSHFLSELEGDGSSCSALISEIAEPEFQMYGGNELNFKEPRPQNKWTEHQREVLCCIRRFFSLRKEDEESIFNKIFEQDLLKCGFANGIPYSSLNTQWVDIRAKGDYVWEEVYLRTKFTEKEGRWAPIVAEIRNAAQQLNVILREKTFDDIDTSKFRCRRPAKPRVKRVEEPILEGQDQTMNQVGVETSSALAALDEIDSITTTPSVDYFPPPNVDDTKKDGLPTAGGKVCFWCSDEGLDIESLLESSTEQRTPSLIQTPAILYRWHNADSNGINTRSWFVAGLFSDNPKAIRLPIDYSDDEFDVMLERHLRIERVSSPFISTTGTPLAPVHRALQKREGAVLTLIDSSKVQTKVYSAQLLMRQKNIKICRYRGYDEFLVWGEIPRQAIICSIKITDLECITANNPDIGALLKLDVIESFEKIRKRMKNKLSLGHGRFDRATGFTVGKLLHYIGIPQIYADNVAERIASSWMFNKKGTPTAYLEGVRVGYMSSSSTDPPSSAPSISHAAIRNLPASITSDLNGNQNSDVHERDAVGIYTDDDSDYDEEEGDEEDKENEEEQDENEGNDDSDDCTIIDDTPCPPPRTGIAEHTSIPELRLPSPALEHPLSEPSGGILDLLNTASETWSPAYQHDNESRPAKRRKQEHHTSESTAVRVEVFNPASRSWPPLANQRGFTLANTQPRHDNNNDNNVIVIDNESESECDENQDYDHDNDGDTSMAEAPVLGTNVQSHREHHRETGRVPESEDQFTRERAHVYNILKLHGILH